MYHMHVQLLSSDEDSLLENLIIRRYSKSLISTIFQGNLKTAYFEEEEG